MKRNFMALLGAAMMGMLIGCTPEEKPTDSNEPDINETPLEVAISEVTNLTPTFIESISGLEAGSSVEAGDTLTLTITPGEILTSGFSAVHMEHIHIHVADTVYMPVFPDTDSDYVQDLKIDIIAPEEDFSIIAAYAVQQKLKEEGFTMRLEENNDGIRLYGVSQEFKYKYFDCYLRTPDAYTLDKVEFKVGDGQWQDVNSVKGCECVRSESLDWVYDIKIRPDYQDVTGDITLRVTGSQHGRYKISWKNTDYILTDIPEGYQPNYLPEEAIDGEEIVASFYTKDGYYLAGASSDVEGVNPECMYYAYVKFTMPASDIAITLDFKELIPVKCTSGSHVESYEIYDSPDIYYGIPTKAGIPGEEVYVFVRAESGYKPSKAVIAGGESFDFQVYGDGTDIYGWFAPVTIPTDKDNVTIEIESVNAYKVTSDEGMFAFPQGRIWAEGETVKFIVYIPSGKNLKGVSAKTSGGTEIPVVLDNADGSFTMPAADVHVSAVFDDNKSDENAHISAIYDDNQYRVFSQTNPYYQSIDANGFDVPKGTALYINVMDYYGEPFWVGVKIGDNVSYYQGEVDPDWGDASFGKTFVISDDAVIKVGASKSSVEFEETPSEVSVKAEYNPDEFIIRSYTNFGWNFQDGFKVAPGTSINLNVQNMYGERFWVGIKIGDDFNAYEAVQDEDTGEYIFNKTIQATADVLIKAGSSQASVQ
ncbi:MAG: hypothetical protein ACI4TU_06705 [Candidatus Cryptobacteroides sp.]